MVNWQQIIIGRVYGTGGTNKNLPGKGCGFCFEERNNSRGYNEVNNEERKKQRSVKSSKGRSKRVAAAAVKNLPAQKRDPQSPPNILLAPSLLP